MATRVAHDSTGTSTPDRRIALLIDADNVSHGKIAAKRVIRLLCGSHHADS